VRAAVVLLGGLVCGPASGQAEAPAPSEYDVKAVYLYNLGRYIVWPDAAISDGDVFTIGVLGGDPFGGALDRVAKIKQLAGKRIVILRLETLDQYRPCHILFVPRTASAEEQAAAIERLGCQPVVLAGETPGFAERGGTLNFILVDGAVRFEINSDTAKRQGLSIDAKLLALVKRAKGS
jgi:hypothetical protein